MSNDGTRRVLAKRLANGDVAVALFNQGSRHHDGLHHGRGDRQDRQLLHAAGRLDQRHQRPRPAPSPRRVPGARHGGLPGQRRRHRHRRRPPFRLRGAASGRCLDVNQGTTANGTQTLIWDCHGGANQQCTQAGQTLQVLGKCLDAPLNAAAGTRVQIWDCNGGTNQQWTFNANGTISSVQFPALCLDVNGNATANGTPSSLWTCHAAANQRWTRQ